MEEIKIFDTNLARHASGCLHETYIHTDRSGTDKSTTDAVVGLGVRSAFFLINNKNSVQILILESLKKCRTRALYF